MCPTFLFCFIVHFSSVRLFFLLLLSFRSRPLFVRWKGAYHFRFSYPFADFCRLRFLCVDFLTCKRYIFRLYFVRLCTIESVKIFQLIFLRLYFFSSSLFSFFLRTIFEPFRYKIGTAIHVCKLGGIGNRRENVIHAYTQALIYSSVHILLGNIFSLLFNISTSFSTFLESVWAWSTRHR